jgi:hypothetical protein
MNYAIECFISLPFHILHGDDMREAIGKLKIADKSRTGILYIPSDLMVDSTLPFKPPEKVIVRIEDQRLIIEKLKS